MQTEEPHEALMFAIGVLVLSGVTTGCRMKADVPPPAQTVTDACAAALAAARQDTEMDRAIGRAQARARAGTGGKEALEHLGYLYVSRARAHTMPATTSWPR